MTTLMQMSLWVNNIAYDIKTLRFFRIVSFIISLVLGLVGFYSYLMLYQTLLFAYGVHQTNRKKTKHKDTLCFLDTFTSLTSK